VATGRILVIAPNSDLRRSLAFALEAEGYVVTTHASIPGSDSSRGYDCVVLDHKAAAGARDAVLSFCRSSHPVLLLAGTPQSWLSSEVFNVVPTPLSGDALSAAVRSAVRADGHAGLH
jgi:DNA-binding NtrC family response regulator